MKKDKKKKFFENITLIFISLLLLNVLTMWIIIFHVSTLQKKNIYVGIIFFLILIYINIAVFKRIRMYTTMFKNYIHEELYLKLLKYDQAYCKQVEDHEREFNIIKHNIKNQLLFLKEIIKQNCDQSEMDRLNLIITDVMNVHHNMYTSNKIVNYILNEKLSNEILKNAKLEVDIELSRYIEIHIEDLGVLFGNILDNAIEACERVEEEKRVLAIKVNMYKSDLFIQVMNSINVNIVDVQSMKTTKKDQKNHGIGLKSIEGIVQKYNGIIEYKSNRYRFETNIILKNEGLSNI